jgi:bacteriorhodopsin
MKNQKFKLSKTVVWLLVLGNLLIIIGAIAKIQRWEFLNTLLISGFVLLLLNWILIFGDIIKNRIYNKTFWIISMIVFPTISPIIYLLRRNRLLHQ